MTEVEIPVFDRRFYTLIDKAVKAAIAPTAAKMLRLAEDTQFLSAKDFWSKKELMQRGWSLKQIDSLVDSGQLARIDAGGSAGFKYPSCQLIKLLEKL